MHVIDSIDMMALGGLLDAAKKKATDFSRPGADGKMVTIKICIGGGGDMGSEDEGDDYGLQKEKKGPMKKGGVLDRLAGMPKTEKMDMDE